MTPAGHRVTVYWDAHRLVKGEDWEEGFATGLLNSVCFLPLLSYGSTAPLATLRRDGENKGWELTPVGRKRLEGAESDPEDNVLKELMIAGTLLEMRRFAADSESGESSAAGKLQLAYPVFVGRQQPEGHPDYPRMGSFFHVSGGGGVFPETPSPPTARAVGRFLREVVDLAPEFVGQVEATSVAAAVKAMTQLQGCQLWNHPPVTPLPPNPLTPPLRGPPGVARTP